MQEQRQEEHGIRGEETRNEAEKRENKSERCLQAAYFFTLQERGSN